MYKVGMGHNLKAYKIIKILKKEKNNKQKMMMKTHIAAAILIIFLLINQATYKLSFIIVAFIMTILPDIDSGFSTIGRFPESGIVRWFTKHRGVIHSFSFCFLATFFLALFWPIIALPFFLGYGLHLFLDSLTVQGIRPFWPLKKKLKWRIKVDSYLETSIFVFLLLADIGILFVYMASV